MGEETEYMVTPWDLEIRQPQLISYFKKSSAPDAFRDFLSNGARLYMDVGNHPEYATPECLTGRGVATAALAGELLLGAALKQPFGKTARQ